MRLMELEPKFLKRVPEGGREVWTVVDSITEADGVQFLCPRCFQTNNGARGTHSCLCWQPHVPREISPGPGRWNLVGTSLDDLTLTAGSSSIQLNGGCNAHFFIENGAIRFA